MNRETMIEEAEIVGLSNGCVECPVPQRVLEAAADLATLGILPEDLPAEIEDVAVIACGTCGDSVLCERVGARIEINIAKKHDA